MEPRVRRWPLELHTASQGRRDWYLLLLAQRGPARGVEAGAAAFGPVSAWLFLGALITGIVILTIRRKAVVIAIHAGIAITGYVLLLAWSSLG